MQVYGLPIHPPYLRKAPWLHDRILEARIHHLLHPTPHKTTRQTVPRISSINKCDKKRKRTWATAYAIVEGVTCVSLLILLIADFFFLSDTVQNPLPMKMHLNDCKVRTYMETTRRGKKLTHKHRGNRNKPFSTSHLAGFSSKRYSDSFSSYKKFGNCSAVTFDLAARDPLNKPNSSNH